MRERLVELLLEKADYGDILDGYAGRRAEEIADHLLANGVILQPCKVGDTVYSIQKTYSKCHLDHYWDEFNCCSCEAECDSHVTYDIREETVTDISWNGRYFGVKTNKYSPTPKAIGERNYGVFLYREEAELALKDLKSNI